MNALKQLFLNSAEILSILTKQLSLETVYICLISKIFQETQNCLKFLFFILAFWSKV
jgi:hypothetical protein